MGCCCVEKQIIQTENAPRAIGPYSIAVRVGDFVYTSGQIGLDPQSGVMVTGGIEAETRQVLTNLKAVVEAAGLTLQDVVKTTVFLKDMGDFAAMNAIYAEFFKENPPARSAVQVAALPKGALVEIEAVAIDRCDCDDECDCDGDCDCDCHHESKD
ncbi:MAG: RidA family protein [Anaerolinea sp.]|nr:RidA family protein [Anaerolinea sp.]